jgi:hypothetical protein
MKKNYFFLSIIILFFSTILLSCNNENQTDTDVVGSTLRGTHALRKLAEMNIQDNRTKRDFFIFTGSMNVENNSSPGVSFAWEQNDSTYILSTLPLNRIRIRFNEAINTPIIKFRWYPGSPYHLIKDDMEKIMKNYIIYAVIYTKRDNWPEQIQLPMNSVDSININK